MFPFIHIEKEIPGFSTHCQCGWINTTGCIQIQDSGLPVIIPFILNVQAIDMAIQKIPAAVGLDVGFEIPVLPSRNRIVIKTPTARFMGGDHALCATATLYTEDGTPVEDGVLFYFDGEPEIATSPRPGHFNAPVHWMEDNQFPVKVGVMHLATGLMKELTVQAPPEEKEVPPIRHKMEIIPAPLKPVGEGYVVKATIFLTEESGGPADGKALRVFANGEPVDTEPTDENGMTTVRAQAQKTDFPFEITVILSGTSLAQKATVEFPPKDEPIPVPLADRIEVTRQWSPDESILLLGPCAFAKNTGSVPAKIRIVFTGDQGLNLPVDQDVPKGGMVSGFQLATLDRVINVTIFAVDGSFNPYTFEVKRERIFPDQPLGRPVVTPGANPIIASFDQLSERFGAWVTRKPSGSA